MNPPISRSSSLKQSASTMVDILELQASCKTCDSTSCTCLAFSLAYNPLENPSMQSIDVYSKKSWFSFKKLY